VIQKVDGKPVTKAEMVQEIVRSKPLSTRITVDFLRNGHPVAVGLISEPLPEAADAMQTAKPRVQPSWPGQ
jgi:S1-C subfamily serine protease